MFVATIPQCTGIGTGSVPVLQVSNFSIPISVSVLDFEAISCPYSLRLLKTQNLPVPVPVLYFSEFFRTPYFMSQFFLVPVPVLRTRTPYPYLNQYQSMLVKAVIIANLTKS